MTLNPLLARRSRRSIIELYIGLLLTSIVLLAPPLLLFAALRNRRLARSAGRHPSRLLQWLASFTTGAALLSLVDAFYIEPNRLSVTRITFPVAAMPRRKRLRILQLSDLHIAAPRNFYRRVVARAAAEHPDLIVITGDILQPPVNPRQRLFAEELFAQLAGIAPLVMIPGGHDEQALPMSPRWMVLQNTWCDTEIKGVPVRLIGWDDGDYNVDWRPPETPPAPDRVQILLTHSPDWFELAAAMHYDLALAGHTHGGQVRLPGWGAVVTATHQGKRFEQGAYRLDSMWAYVTRGIGQNPWPTPPVRFLCRPEMVVITLRHR